MSDNVLYSDFVANYTGGEKLLLEIFERDGQVGIRLGPNACLLSVDEAHDLQGVIESAQVVASRKEPQA